MQLFALDASRPYGERVAAQLKTALAPHEERVFEDGEHKSRPLVSVRGRDAFVIHSLYADAEHSADDKLCRLLFFLGALRDAAAGRITAVVPYLCYARKDRKTKARDPVITRYLAQLLEAVGVDCVLTLDVHNLSAYQNAFRCGAEHLEARHLFAATLAPRIGAGSVTVVSPDEGGLKRADGFRRALAAALGRDVGMGFMEKFRRGATLSGQTLFADVHDRDVVLFDDLISTGQTMLRAARAARAQGARRVHAVATHGLFTEGAAAVVGDPALERVLVADTVPPFRLDPALAALKLQVVDTTELLGQAIARLHAGESLSALSGGEED
jgi:ribose-phosphate pyrophosphokinase